MCGECGASSMSGKGASAREYSSQSDVVSVCVCVLREERTGVCGVAVGRFARADARLAAACGCAHARERTVPDSVWGQREVVSRMEAYA